MASRAGTKPDGDLWFRYQLAEHLGKSLDEVNAMTIAEYVGWKGYLRAKAELAKRKG